MNDNEKCEPRSFRLTKRHLEIIQGYADAQYEGNGSMALRRIIDDWEQDKHDAERQQETK